MALGGAPADAAAGAAGDEDERHGGDPRDPLGVEERPRVAHATETTKASTMPAMATTPPTSKRRNGPNPNGETIGRQASAATPTASRMRSSVGPTPRNVILNTPRTWVAR